MKSSTAGVPFIIGDKCAGDRSVDIGRTMIRSPWHSHACTVFPRLRLIPSGWTLIQSAISNSRTATSVSAHVTTASSSSPTVDDIKEGMRRCTDLLLIGPRFLIGPFVPAKGIYRGAVTTMRISLAESVGATVLGWSLLARKIVSRCNARRIGTRSASWCTDR
jgi:hypothetical protein